MAIQNKTPNYGLPLPQGNEVMAYQDFINEPMQIIDTQMKSNADGVASNKADLVTANQNITEADGKITAIQENLTEWNVPGIINEQTSMDQRLTAVENTTMEFVHPSYDLFITLSSGGDPARILRTGGLFIPTTCRVKLTEPTAIAGYINYYSKSENNSSLTYLSVGSMPGNVFNLPNVNKMYVINRYSYYYHLREDSNQYKYYWESGKLGLMWNGSETLVYLTVPSNLSDIDILFLGETPIAMGIY